jgi:hypothetical protein
MEGYITKRCCMGTNIHFATLSTSQALRKRPLFRGRESRVLTSLTPSVDGLLCIGIYGDPN